MLLELTLILPLYILIWYALIKYRDIIKARSSLDSLLPNLTDEVFGNDIPEEEVYKKRETLKDAIQY